VASAQAFRKLFSLKGRPVDSPMSAGARGNPACARPICAHANFLGGESIALLPGTQNDNEPSGSLSQLLSQRIARHRRAVRVVFF